MGANCSLNTKSICLVFKKVVQVVLSPESEKLKLEGQRVELLSSNTSLLLAVRGTEAYSLVDISI